MYQLNLQQKIDGFFTPERKSFLKETAALLFTGGALATGLKQGVYRDLWESKSPLPSSQILYLPILAAPIAQLPATSTSCGIDLSSKRKWTTLEEGTMEGIKRLFLDIKIQKTLFQDRQVSRIWKRSLKPYLHRKDFSAAHTKKIENIHRTLARRDQGQYTFRSFQQSLANGLGCPLNTAEQKVQNILRQLSEKKVLSSLYSNKKHVAQWRSSLHPYLRHRKLPHEIYITTRIADLVLGRLEKGCYRSKKDFQKAMENAFHISGIPFRSIPK